MSNKNLETTKFLFRAFDDGNIPAILDRLAHDVQWEYGPVSHDVPWYQKRVGIESVNEFFLGMSETPMTRFEPTEFIAEGNTVVVLLQASYTVRSTGQNVVYDDAVMIWKFNDDGKVAKFAHRVDTHQAWLAFHRKNASTSAAA